MKINPHCVILLYFSLSSRCGFFWSFTLCDPSGEAKNAIADFSIIFYHFSSEATTNKVGLHTQTSNFERSG